MSYDIRKQAYAAGEQYGTKAERARICDQLEDISGSADLQGAVLQLIGQLQGSAANTATTSSGPITADRAAEMIAAAKRGSARQASDPSDDFADCQGLDLTDKVTVAMLRGKGRHAEANKLISDIRGAK
jgi:hypothetical protein